jgi:hypothetical protein
VGYSQTVLTTTLFSRLQNVRWGHYLALLFAGVTTAILIRAGLFVAGGSDSSSYISASALWRIGFLYRPEAFHFWPMWPEAADIAAPLGYRAGPIVGTEVPVYPPGFPMLMAAASLVFGPPAAHLVAPLMAGLLVLATYAVGRQLGGSLGGLVAAALIGSSPELLMHGVQAMSDAPAAACWIGAWWLALRGTTSSAVAAGFACAMASLIRPNLTPLAGVIAAIILIGERGVWRWRPLLVFSAPAALGPLLVAWSQAVLYGNPLTPGYPDWQALFSTDYIVNNLALYPRLFVASHSYLPIAGFIAVPLMLTNVSTDEERLRRRVAISAVALASVNIAVYLPYAPYDQWPFLRFLLPGTAALFVLFGGTLALAVRVLTPRLRFVAFAVPFVILAVVWPGVPFARYALQDWRAQGNIRLMGHYLDEVLPTNAVVLAYTHSGAVAHYTGRDVIRMDLLAGTLDRFVDDLIRRGHHPVFVIDQELEEGPYRQLFANSRFGQLDWEPRARFTTVTSIWYLDPLDREPYLRGARWPIDTLR